MGELSWWLSPHPAWEEGEVEALELEGEPRQVLFFIREHATLVSGDVLT